MIIRSILLLLYGLFSFSTANAGESTHLYAPTGPYQIGYQDFHWINPTICPDPYFNGKNQADFSPENQQQFCREIMTRIYYPSSQVLAQGDLSYLPMVRVWQKNLIATGVPNITQEDIAALELIRTYTKQNLIPAAETFPVLVFNPGLDDDAQNYEDVIVDLVSHGYIVVAINNTFVSSAVEFPDQHVVHYDSYATAKKMKDAAVSDITFISNEIHGGTSLPAIFNHMDKTHVGLFGHSLGAVATVILAHQHPHWFNVAAALAAPAYHADYAAYRGFKIPFMHLHDANWDATYARIKGSNQFHLTPQEYLVLLSPDQNDINYSRHNNFSDLSTLQYHPTFQAFSDYEIGTGNAYPLDVGTILGQEAIYLTNEYLLQFFDNFLKDKPSQVFQGCISLQNTSMDCGPTL